MARTVVAIYDDFQTANNAVRDLVDNGFPRDNISIIANNTRGEYAYTPPTNAPASAPGAGEGVAGESGAGAGVGAGIGAAIGGIGGLLVGLGALVIPGIGPVIAAGPLAVALSTLTGAGVGAVAGGVTGGLLGALIGLGVPEEEAQYYAEGVRRGGVLVTIQGEDGDTERVMELLNHHKPVDIRQRASEWREQGWDGNDPKAPESIQAVEVNQPASSMRQLDTETTQQNRGMAEMNQPASGNISEENPNYHNHYNTYLSNSGYPFDYYAPAYKYGYGLASDARYQKSTWDVVSPDVRHNWELEHPGTWERFQTAIRHAWEDANGQSKR